jgi:hydrogenase 3 maturation protease
MDYLVMCIGNRYGGDDGIGPYIADCLNDNKKITAIDCGIIPENYTSVVKKYNPKNLIIIDAAEMDLKPGEIRLINKEKIGLMHISTHNIPISLLINYLEKYVKNIHFIGIQPNKMAGELSEVVKKSAKKLIEILNEWDIEKIQKLK